MKGRWKRVNLISGDVEVSDFGEVRDCITKKIYAQSMQSSGYLQIHINKNYKDKHYLIHRLVAEAFVPNKGNKKEVNHIDGNKENNNANNLEWCTHKENTKHRDAVLGKNSSRPVMCIESGELWGSITECALTVSNYPTARSHIAKAIKLEKTFKGKHYKYADQNNNQDARYRGFVINN